MHFHVDACALCRRANANVTVITQAAHNTLISIPQPSSKLPEC